MNYIIKLNLDNDNNDIINNISLLSQYTILDHIGYTQDSYVYTCYKKDNKNDIKVLKIIRDIEYNKDSNIDKLINENKNIYDELDIKINSEFKILKENKSNHLLKLIDYFYIILDYTGSTFGDITKIRNICIITDKCDYDITKLDLSKYDYNIKKQLCLQLCEGIDELHKRNLCHGDLKLYNIGIKMINYIPNIIILDFGVTKSITNDKNILNTFPFITPISTYNHIKMNYIKIHKKWIDNNLLDLELLLLNTYNITYPSYYKGKRLLYDDRIKNEIYVLGILFIYILSDGYHFYSNKIYDNKYDMNFFDNIIKLVNNREDYIYNFVYNILSNKLDTKTDQWFLILKDIITYNISLNNIIEFIKKI